MACIDSRPWCFLSIGPLSVIGWVSSGFECCTRWGRSPAGGHVASWRLPLDLQDLLDDFAEEFGWTVVPGDPDAWPYEPPEPVPAPDGPRRRAPRRTLTHPRRATGRRARETRRVDGRRGSTAAGIRSMLGYGGSAVVCLLAVCGRRGRGAVGGAASAFWGAECYSGPCGCDAVGSASDSGRAVGG